MHPYAEASKDFRDHSFAFMLMAYRRPGRQIVLDRIKAFMPVNGARREQRCEMSNFAARSILKGLFLGSLFVILAGGSAVAVTTDDVKWINQCVKDNADQDAKRLVVLKYCTCMNNKMSDDETQSITEWEKTHPEEQKACEEQAGWD